jgi:4-hydroxybenzoyl-CoA thioesterase/acyl-CoA thioester hydrolase
VETPSFAPGEYHYHRRVQFAETDLAGIVHFSWYFKYMEEAEHALWRAAGLSVAAGDLHWPRVSAACDYKQPLRFEDEIDVAVRAAFGRRRMQYAFTVLRAGTAICSGAMTSVCARLDGSALKPIDIPADVVERLRRALSARAG